jgi:hypothetical protein
MWTVWFYTVEGRKLIDRFHSRNEAEHYGQKLGRLTGLSKAVVVCFDQDDMTDADWLSHTKRSARS